jgi:hypothetical protein
MHALVGLTAAFLVLSGAVALGQASAPLASPAPAWDVPDGAETIEGPGEADWLDGVIFIDGGDRIRCKVTVLSATPGSAEGQTVAAGVGTTPCGACPSIVDAWTASIECAQTCEARAETYAFQADGDPARLDRSDICFLTLVRVPGGGLPNGLMMDIVVVRYAPRTPDTPRGEDLCFPRPSVDRRPVAIIDDVEIDPLPASPTGCPYDALIAVCVADLNVRLAATCGGPRICAFDWFQVVEFDPSRCPDVDGDGKRDVGFLFGEGRDSAFCLTSTTDNYGAEVIDFFANLRQSDVRCLNILEPHPPAPARPCSDVFAGEDAQTRPWCFTVHGPATVGGADDGDGAKKGGAILPEDSKADSGN